MRLFKRSIGILGIFLWLVNQATAYAMDPAHAHSHRPQQDSTGLFRIGGILAGIADESDYRAVKWSVVERDEWDEDEPRRLLAGHSYYSLFSRDPKSLLDLGLGPMHQGVSSKSIQSTVLVFKNAESAAGVVARLTEKNLGNIGAILKQSDSKGFYISPIGRSYCAVRH